MGVGYPLDIVICVALGVDMLLACPGHANMRAQRIPESWNMGLGGLVPGSRLLLLRA